MKELVLGKGWDERLSVLAQFMILWVYNIIFPLVLGFRLISETHTKKRKGRQFYSIRRLQKCIIKFKSEGIIKVKS